MVHAEDTTAEGEVDGVADAEGAVAMHAEVDGAFDGGGDVDVVAVRAFVLNMPSDYALPHDGGGGGDEAVGGKNGDHQQLRHNGCGNGAVDETSQEVPFFERHIEQGENEADGSKADERREVGDGEGEHGLGKIPSTHDGNDDEGEEGDKGKNGHEPHHPFGVAVPKPVVEVAEPLDGAFLAYGDADERLQLEFGTGVVVAGAGRLGLHELIATLLVGVEDELVARAVVVGDGQLVGRGTVETDVEHLVGGEAVHGVARELEPRLRGDAAVVGEGGLEVEAEVGKIPPLAQAAGTHGKGVAAAGGEEFERGDRGFGVELLSHLAQQMLCFGAGSALYQD